MPRPLRIQAAGGLFHVTCRGNRGQEIFRDSRDYRHFLSTLSAVVAHFGWRCHAYCLMPNHVHLLIETPVPNLSAGMQRLNSHHAIYFNRRYGYRGHLFQGRFHSELVHSDSHLLAAIRYILMNPVRARLCREPGDWPWSSHRATAGAEPKPSFLSLRFILGLFAGPIPRAAFVDYIDDG
jgi:REP element-mobilizing transposase RayT